MTDSTASLRRKIDSAADLQSVVRTMKAMAASNIGQYEQAVHALGDYYRSVELGLSIRRVDVHVSDAIGSKTGHGDKCCMIEARRDGREPIIVTHQESTIDQAIQGAVHNLKKSVDSALGEEFTQANLRDHH